MLQDWTAALCAELGVDLDVDVSLLLDAAREAAHTVTRPAAPVTTFLIGYAAAQRGGGPEEVARAAGSAVTLAARWDPGETRQPR